jgi:hypothetical protein
LPLHCARISWLWLRDFFLHSFGTITMHHWIIRVAGLFVALVCVGGARAQGLALDDGHLSQVWGQAMIELVNTSSLGYDFTRMTLNADVTLSANFKDIRLGEYAAARNGPTNGLGAGADIDIGALQLGRYALGDSESARYVRATNPYFEFVYKQGTTAATREVVGMRVGFEGLQGLVGTQMRALSGSLRADISTTAGMVNFDSMSGATMESADGKRANGNGLLPTVGTFKLGDASGPTRDFFLAVQSQNVTYPSIAGLTSQQAAAGFWLNLRDRVSGVVGAMPSNLAVPK